MTPEQIARVAYEAIRATAVKAKPAWEEAAEKDRKTYIDRVGILIKDPTVEPGTKATDEEKAKAKLFGAVVFAITSTPPAAPVMVDKPVHVNMTAVKYIGHRERYGDGIAGTGLFWMKGETLMVPKAPAEELLKNPLVWVKGNPEDATGHQAVKPRTLEPDQTDTDAIRIEISVMDTTGLVDFAKAKYGQALDITKPVETLRIEVAGLVDQYGVV